LSENFPLTGLPNVNSSPNFRSNIFSGDAQRHELHPGTHVVEGNFGVFQPHQLESIDTPVNYLTPKRNTDSVHSSTEHIDRYLVPRVIDSPDQLLVSELQTLRLSFSSVISSSQSIVTHSDDEGFHDSHSAAGILIVKFSSGMLLSCFELFQAISGLSLFTNSSADSMRHIKFITSSILSSISQLQGVIENIKHEFHELENLHAQRLGKKIQQHCQNINTRKLKFTFHKWSMTTTCMLQAKQKDSSKEMFSILSNVQTQKFNAIHSKWKRELGDKKFLLWKLALLQKSVTCLKSNWFESKKLMANSMKVVYRIMNMHVARCFTQWMDHLRTMKKVKKCMGVLLKKSMVCCFYAWQEYATDKKETSKRLQAAARKILGKWMHGGVSRAFERWLRFAQEEKKLRAKCKTVVYRIMNMHVARCFTQWMDHLRTMKKVKKCTGVLLKKSMVCCFYAWQEYATDKKETSKRLQAAARKILGKWMHGGVSRAFERWLRFAQEEKKLRAKCKTVVYRIMNMHVARCFTQWMDHLRTMKKVKKCTGVLLKKSMVCCFYAWQEYATDKKETSKRLQAAARKILGKWMHGGVSRAFERWLRFAQEEKKLRAKCKTVVYRIMNMHVARCFTQWMDHLRTMKKVKKCMGVLLKKSMVCCFYAWQEYATDKKETSKRLQAAARKILGKWMHGGVSRAFERWLRFAQEEKKLRAKCKTVVYRIMNMHVARCFTQWMDHLRTMKKVKKCMGVLLKKSMVCCFYAWQEYATDKKETSKRLQAAARKILGKWMHGGVSRAFERWLRFAQEEKKLRAKCKTVVYRIMNMHVARCFTQWMDHLRTMKKVKKCTGVLLKKSMVCCFYAWQEYATDKKETSKRLQAAARKILGKWMHGGVSRAFERWLRFAQEEKKLRAKCKTVVYRIMNMHVARCFTQWMDHLRTMKKVKKCMGVLLKKSMVCCFYAWQEYATDKKETSKRLQAAARKILGKWMHGGVSRAFERWLRFAQEEKKLRAKCKTVVYRIMNMHVARCFTQWMDHLRTMKKVKKCMGVLLKKSMVCCFYAWQEYATDKKETSKRLQAAARKILGKWMHGGVSRAFERWLRFAQEEKKLRAKCKTVVYRISNSIASRCISVWICFVQSSKRASWLLTRADSLSIKQSHWFHRVRILSLGLHFHFFRRHFKTRRSLSFRLRYKGYSLLRSYFSTWFTHIHAVKIQRDDEFTVSVLKSVSNFPLQHYLEEHAAKRIHSSRTQFCRSFEKQLELMQEKASSFNFLQSVSC
jgi:hypothetical protein